MTRDVSPAQRRRLTGIVLSIAFAVRLLFWHATPDREWPHAAAFKGDAVVWTDYAHALTRGADFELGLPLRPPANAYLLAALGVETRQDAWRAKPVWCLLGALAVTVLFRAALAAFGLVPALTVALWCTFSTALLRLSTSLNNETPYLVLVALLLGVAQRLAETHSTSRQFAWGSLNAIACLFRVEHLVFFALGTVWIAWRRWQASRRSPGRRVAFELAPALAAFAIVLLPWHLAAWRTVARFNNQPAALGPAGEAAQRSVEQATRGLVWTPDAEAERARLPAFARRSAANFVAATVQVRGGRSVDAGDFEILDQAFGYRPRPLPRPFVALYGPLNFYLANREEAPPGFDVSGLDRLPPLEGGLARYPRSLLAGLPPPNLNFYYPPHVELVTDGYRLGSRWIAGNPGTFLRRAMDRLDILWQGASMGWSGYGLPWGEAGPRRAVDLAVPDGQAFRIWRWALLALCVLGLASARSSDALARVTPWLLFVVTKIVATALFFGYARHGAALVPVVALLVGLLVTRLEPIGAFRQRPILTTAAVLAVLGLGLEVARWIRPPDLTLDGAPITRGDPHPLLEHADRELGTRRSDR